MDVALILDLSGSVEDKRTLILDFARRLTKGFNINTDMTRVAAVAFSTEIIGRYDIRSLNVS